MHIRNLRRVSVVLAILAAWAAIGIAQAPISPRPFPGPETLTYNIEWRLVTAGTAKIGVEKSGGGWQANLELDSAGLVSKLYKIEDRFSAHYEGDFCVQNSSMNVAEGKRRREVHASYDYSRRKASYTERDAVKNTVKNESVDLPAGCVHDTIGALMFLRRQTIQTGHSIELPVSDGKKYAAVRVEAQDREDLKINGKTYKTVRYEAFIFNKVIYQRTGRMFIWLTDDNIKLPVKLQVRASFPIGTVTLQLDKYE